MRPALPPALAKIRCDQAAQELIASCRAANEQATAEEILHFLELRVAHLRRRPKIEKWREYLLDSVPRDFQGLTIELEKCAEHRR